MQKLFFEVVAYYLRNTSIEKGRYRLLTLARPIGRKLGRTLGKRKLRTRHGFMMELDLCDWIPQDIYLTGDFESTSSAIAKKLLKPGDTVVDVGANIGYFSLLFAHCVGNTGSVYSFEPVPALASKLEKNVELNHFGQVIVSTIALSDHRGTARFYSGPEDNTGLSSLREPRQSSGSFDAELAPFDDLVKDSSAITLVKIDVEGAELQVLRGMERLLRNARPNLLLEVTDTFLRELGDSASSLLAFLDQFGYVCYLIGDGLTLLEKSQNDLPKQWNALFTSKKLFGQEAVFS